MSNLWKIKREGARIFQQLRAVPEAFFEPHLNRAHNRLMAGVTPIKGSAPASPKIAIHLILQPKGLAPDTIAKCDFLREAGYAPFVIANGGLTDGDIDRLAPHVWQILIRPNFGYDFGGHRDGILWLLKMQTHVERLVILNDSVYVPTIGGDAFLRQIEASSFDIAGGILRTRGQERFLESYFYSFSRAALGNEDFQNFWRTLALTNNKYKVIRRCERGFSRAMGRSDLSLGALYSNADFIEKAGAQSPDFLRLCLHYGAYRAPADTAQCKALLVDYSETAQWHARAMGFVKQVLEKDVFNSAFCFGAVHLLGFPFLKKSKESVNLNWRKAYIAAVIAGDLPAPPKAIMDMLEKGD